MRLVKEQAKQLSKENAGALMQLVKYCQHRDIEYFEKMKQARGWVQGDYWEKLHKEPSMQSDEIRGIVNLAHSHIQTLGPTLYHNDPYIRCAPAVNRTYEHSSPVWEDLINVYIRRAGFTEQTKKVVLDGMQYPEGWKKWQVIANNDRKAETGEGPLTKESAVGSTVESGLAGLNQFNHKQAVVGIRVSPLDVITDCPNRTIDNSRFIAIKYRKFLSELEADPRYSKSALAKYKQENPSAQNHVPQIIGPTISEGYTPHDEKEGLSHYETPVDLWEIWVYQLVDYKLYRQLVVMIDNDSNVLRMEKWTDLYGPHMTTYPITQLVLNPIADSKPQSEIAVFWGLQKNLNWFLTRALAQTGNHKQIVGVDPSAFKNATEAIDLLNSGRSHIYIPMNSNVDAQRALFPVQMPAVHQDIWRVMPMMIQMTQMVSGLGDNQRGTSVGGTATEASIINAHAQTRLSEKVSKVAKFIEKDIEIMVSVLRHIMPQDFVFGVTGKTGTARWQKFSPLEAAWSPDIEIQVDSFRGQTTMERLEHYNMLMSHGMNLAQMYGRSINLDTLFERMLEAAAIPQASEIVNTQIPGNLKQLNEIVAAMAGLPIEVLPTDDHRTEIGVIDMVQSAELIWNNIEPQIQQALLVHKEEHIQMLQEMEQSAVSSSGDPNTLADTAHQGQSGNEQAAARQQTSQDRSEGFY